MTKCKQILAVWSLLLILHIFYVAQGAYKELQVVIAQVGTSPLDINVLHTYDYVTLL